MRAGRALLSVLVLMAVAGAAFALSAVVFSRQAAARAQFAVSQGPALLTSYLDLTPDQQKRIAPINEAFRTHQHAACIQMQEARAGLLSVLRQPRPGQEDIDAALADLERSQADLQRRAAQYLLDLKPILNEDQQAKLFDLVGERFCEQGRCGGGICPGIGKPGCGGRPGCMR